MYYDAIGSAAFFLSAKPQAESYNLNIVKYFYAEQLWGTLNSMMREILQPTISQLHLLTYNSYNALWYLPPWYFVALQQK